MKASRLIPIGLAGWLATGSTAVASLGLDRTFTPGDGPDGPVRTIAIHRGERILIGGGFQHYQGVARPGLARLLPDGTLDVTFDPTGALAGEVEELVPVPETGVLIAGRFSLPGNTNAGVGLARLEWDGSRDPTFAPPLEWRPGVRGFVGWRLPPPIHFGLAPDRSVVLDARPFRVAGREVDALVRLRPDGSWDESFRPDISLRDWDVRRVAVAPDGSVWVAGHLGGEGSPAPFGLVHFNADGSWDRRFSSEGLPRQVEDIALLPGGQVVGYGTGLVFRLLPDGTRDPTFQVAEFSLPPGAMALSPEGRVFLGPFLAPSAEFKSVNGIRRNSLALLDPTGRLVVNADLSQEPEWNYRFGVWAAAIDRQGRILLSGDLKSINGEPCSTLVRLEEFTGPPYPTTVYWGAASYTVSEGAGAVTLLCVRQGSVSGQGLTYVRYATVPESAQDGSDFTGRSGLVVFGADEQVRTVQVPILEDDLEEGWETFLVVLNPGAEPPAGDTNRMVTRVYIRDNDHSYHLSRLGNSEITVSESSQRANISFYIATTAKWDRLASPLVPPEELIEVEYEELGARAGRDYLPLVRPLFQNVDPGDNLDPVGVYARFLLPILDNAEWDGPRQVRIHLRSRHPRVVFAPSMTTLVVNITDNDNAAGAGRFIHGNPERLAPARGGRWLIAGSFDAVDALPRPGLARLEPDGAVEETFAPTVGPDGPVQVLLEGPEGEVVVAGQFRHVGNRARSGVVRYRPSGELEDAFIPPDSWDTASAPVNYLHGALQSDGRLVLAGVGRFHGPGLTPGVVRLLPDGRADPDFHLTDPGFSVLTAMAVLPDQRVLVAGRHALTWTNVLRRLLADGQPDPEFELSSPAVIRALWTAADGSLWVGTEAGLLRLPSGLQAPPGTALVEVGQWIHPYSTLALVGQPDGRILSAWRDNGAWVSRFLPDGSSDPEFNRFSVEPTFVVWVTGNYSIWPGVLAVTDTGFIGTLEPYNQSGPLHFYRHTPDGRSVTDMRIERLVRLPSGEVHGRLRGSGFWAVQRSTKLTRDWVDVYTLTRFPAWPPFNFVDTNAVRYPYAFYRVR